MKPAALEQEVIYLRNRVNELERIIEMLPGHIYWQNLDNMFLGCNLEQAKSAGLTSCQQIIGTTPYNYLSKDQADAIAKVNSEVMATGIPQYIEEPATFADGTERTFLSHKLPLKGEDGEIIGLLGVSLDITRQKELEKQLDEAKQIAEATLDGIISVLPGNAYWKDKEGRYLGCNDEVARLLNLPGRKAIIGKTDYDLLAGSVAENIAITDNAVMKMGVEKTLEESGKDSQGNPAFYVTSKAPLHNKAGEITGLVGISINITDRKKMELALIKAKEKAEVADRAKSEFLTNMSHDIRTPLNGILGFAQILEQREESPEKKEFLNIIYKSSKRLVKLLDEIINLVNIETYGLPVQYVAFDIRAMLIDLNELIMAEAQVKNLELKIDVSPKLPALIIGDKLRTHRILLNLLGNAVKFTHIGGIYVTINIKEFVQQQIILTIEVRDTGIGIAQDKFEIIFNKFSRLTLSDSSPYSGTGLGLYIVNKFVQDMLGKISIESKVGEGTTFICELPFNLPAN